MSEYDQLNIVQLKRLITKNFIGVLRNKLGKVLTVIDGCVSDAEQRKAIKELDLIQ